MTRAAPGTLVTAWPRPRPTVVLGLMVAFATLALGVVSAVAGHRQSGMWLGGDGAAGAFVAVAAGAALVLAGLESWRRGRRRVAVLLVAAGLAWYASGWSYPTIESDVLFTLGLAVGQLYPAVALHLLLAAPSGVTRVGRERAVIAVGYVMFGLLLGLVPALAFDPGEALCRLCPTNHLALLPSPELPAAVSRFGTGAAVVWVIAALLVLALRFRALSSASRRLQAATHVAGAALLTLVGAEAARETLAPVPPTDPLSHQILFAQALSLIAIAAGVGLEWLQARRAKERIARVVADLTQAPPPGGLRDALATLLDDPALQVAYPVGSDRFADVAGRPVMPDRRDGRQVTSIVREGSVVALLDHRRDVLDDPRQVDEVIAVARLGLEHERLQAVARARLAELREARRRIVATGDETRRRLERDLHDGTQQRLLAIAIELRLVRDPEPAVRQALDEVAAEVQLALDELRVVAHGLYPAILADEGLAAAIEGLVEGASAPVTVAALPDRRVDPAAEASAYHVVAEAVRTTRGPVGIRCVAEDGRLVAEVAGADPPLDVFEDLADRVGAADGVLTRIARNDGTPVLRAEVPCVS